MAKIPLEVLNSFKSICNYDIGISEAYVITVSQDYEQIYLMKASMMAKTMSELKILVKHNTLKAPASMKEKVFVFYVGSIREAKEAKYDLERVLAEEQKSIDDAKRKSQNVASTSNSRKTVDNSTMTMMEVAGSIRSLHDTVQTMAKNIILVLDHVKALKEGTDDACANDSTTTDFYNPNLKVLDRASKAIKAKRNNSKWVRKIRSLSVNGMTEDDMKQVRKELINGSFVPSKLVIALGCIVFGESLLKDKLLGENGVLSRKARISDRKNVIPVEKENMLRAILMELDDIFLDNWQVLVRGPINQKGREFKSKRVKRARDDSCDEESDSGKEYCSDEHGCASKRSKRNEVQVLEENSNEESTDINTSKKITSKQHDNTTGEKDTMAKEPFGTQIESVID